MNTPPPGGLDPMLAIPVASVCFVARKLREYETGDLLAEREDPPNPLEHADVEGITGHEDEYSFDPVRQELVSFIGDLPADQKMDLVALMWLGRGNATLAEWPSIRADAADAHNARTAHYLLGSPMAGDFLEEGLSTLGYACAEPDAGAP